MENEFNIKVMQQVIALRGQGRAAVFTTTFHDGKEFKEGMTAYLYDRAAYTCGQLWFNTPGFDNNLLNNAATIAQSVIVEC